MKGWVVTFVGGAKLTLLAPTRPAAAEAAEELCPDRTVKTIVEDA